MTTVSIRSSGVRTPTKIFLSHSHHDKELAGTLKDELEGLGCEVFVAHEDINPSQDWQEAILKSLRECDAFIPLLTESFAASDWTDQETGIAIALRKVIVPIKIQDDPYGFIGKIQALKWDIDDEELSFKKLVKVLLDKALLTVEDLILRFSNSHSYADATLNSELLESDIDFTKDQINSIVRYATGNGQIAGSYGAVPILNRLFSAYSNVIDPKLMLEWRAPTYADEEPT